METLCPTSPDLSWFFNNCDSGQSITSVLLVIQTPNVWLSARMPCCLCMRTGTCVRCACATAEVPRPCQDCYLSRCGRCKNLGNTTANVERTEPIATQTHGLAQGALPPSLSQSVRSSSVDVHVRSAYDVATSLSQSPILAPDHELSVDNGHDGTASNSGSPSIIPACAVTIRTCLLLGRNPVGEGCYSIPREGLQ